MRDLAERGVLVGERGSYVCRTDVAEVSVPATLQATIAARIDRLDPAAKHTLIAAAVIGSRFDRDLLASLESRPGHRRADRRRANRPSAVHPARRIRVSASADPHGGLRIPTKGRSRPAAPAAGRRDRSPRPESADQNAALIAEHLEAAGDLHAAYGWHMRAATWATNRDISAARLSWERAQQIADALPADDPDRAAMRIAPRTMLCGIAFRVHVNVAGDRFDELRELCTAAGDKASLAIAHGRAGADHAFHDRMRERRSWGPKRWHLIESIGDPTLDGGTVPDGDLRQARKRGVVRGAAVVTGGDRPGRRRPVHRRLHFWVALADRRWVKGIAALSPGACWMARRCAARPSHGPQRRAVSPAQLPSPGSTTWEYRVASWQPTNPAMREIEDALQNAERFGDDLGAAIMLDDTGQCRWYTATPLRNTIAVSSYWPSISDVFLRNGQTLGEVPLVNVYAARVQAGAAISMTPYRSCAPPPTTCFVRGGCWPGTFL